MNESKQRRIGILGSGFIVSECHLVSYRKAGFNPVAIASRTPENARKVAGRFDIVTVYSTYEELLDDASLEILDIAVPPQEQPALIRAACKRGTAKAILAQKPLALDFHEAAELVQLCEEAGILLVVNQNMRHDPSVKAAKELLNSHALGEPVFATIDMRGIPHWQPWQAETGGASLKIMSIHHLDCMRYWFGNPERLFCSMRSDPRTQFPHEDGICTYVLEYANGLRAVIIDDVWTGPAREGCPGDIRITWRVEGLDGLAIGDIGWCKDPYTSPSSIRHARKGDDGFHQPPLEGSWFPDAFGGVMAEVLAALDGGPAPSSNGRDNLSTLALIEAALVSVREHRAVALSEIHP
jgi:predicted dehydrogenase